MRRALFPLLLCLLLCACATVSPEPQGEPPEAIQPAEESGPAVYTDWSKLGRREPLPETVGSRWYGDYMDELLPRDDYGPLVPYAGLRLMDDWPAATGCLYGLMTQDGVVVTEPVYGRITCPNGLSQSGPYALPLLVLKRFDETSEDDWDPAAYAVAARDGSWCTPFDYCGYSHSEQGLLLFRQDSVTVMAPDGEILRVWTVEEMDVSQKVFDDVLGNVVWSEGFGGLHKGDYMAIDWVDNGAYDRVLCFDLVNGGLAEVPETQLFADYPEWERPPSPVPDANFRPDSVLGVDAPGLLQKSDYSGDRPVTTYYREDGTPLPELTDNGERWYRQVNLIDGLVEVLDWNTATYYDLETWECVFRTYLSYEGD